MTILFGWAPARFVEKHEENVALFFRINLVQSLIQTVELEEALGHEVILDALVLKVAVHRLYKLQIGQGKTD